MKRSARTDRKDAERYRYLRDAENDFPNLFIAMRGPINVVSQAKGKAADFAIDQAIKHTSKRVP